MDGEGSAVSTPTTYATPPPVPGRPILVSILAILVGLVGIFLVVVGVILLALGLFIPLGIPAPVFAFPLTLGLLLVGILTLILGAVLVAVASGLWHLESWALWLTGIVVVIELIGQVLPPPHFGLLALLYLFLLVYLVAVRRHFH